MAAKLNRHFNNIGQGIGSKNERNLIQKLVNEAIQIHGFQITYIVREDVSASIKQVFREDNKPVFEDSFTIEAYVNLDAGQGFEGGGIQNTPYGLRLDQVAKVLISKSRWLEEHTQDPVLVPSRPRAGDLVLISFGTDPDAVDDSCSVFPNLEDRSVNDLNPKLFEIVYFNDEPDNNQLKSNFYYRITLRLFDHSNEDIKLTYRDPNTYQVHKNYEFNEQETLDKLRTSGLDAVLANTNPETKEEYGNIKDVVATAQNRELEVEAEKVSSGRRAVNSPLTQCDNELPKARPPFELPPNW